MSRPVSHDQVMEALAAPFEGNEIRHKPGVVSGNRALAIPYLDARAIQDRLDEVLGLAHWQDEYECLPDGSVICRLRIRVGEEWITKVDVGGPSEQPDEGDRRKAAFSDALKRAAVKFGIGRYLHRQTPQWLDFDPVRKQFVRPSQNGGGYSNGGGNTKAASSGGGYGAPRREMNSRTEPKPEYRPEPKKDFGETRHTSQTGSQNGKALQPVSR